MYSKEQLKEIIVSQKEAIDSQDIGLIRTDYLKLLKESIHPKIVTILKGPRRVGKSTIVLQFIKEINNNYYYFDFDDERIANFKTGDFETLMLAFQELYQDKDYLLFDEIQNIDSWELFINRQLKQNKKIIITGSNSKLLSADLGTHLTGRHIDIEIFPFSFKEYLYAKDFKTKQAYTIKEKAELEKLFKDYQKTGGFPQVVFFYDYRILQELYRDIIEKDTKDLKSNQKIKDVSDYLLFNISTLVSLRSIQKNFGLKNTNEAKAIIKRLEATYLFQFIEIYSNSYKERKANPMKCYSIDVGLVNNISTKLVEDRGQQFENLVYLKLRKENAQIYYYKKKGETDFIVIDNKKPILVAQACSNLADNKTKEREVSSLLECMDQLNIKVGIIINKDLEKEETIDGKRIKFIPIINWLLE
ncbi:MAG TPA: ATP-binding protein [archaeon]|jgi:uncharacterized protein|nr:ATP-binding protein [archaeon]